jgi:hypothetical protein
MSTKSVRRRHTVSITCDYCGVVFQRETYNPKQPPKYCSIECTPTGRPFEARFGDIVMPEPNSGCWLILGQLTDRGYGHISLDGVVRPTHNAAYRYFVGDIPGGYEVDHLCRNTSCANPAHLEAVTHRVNVLRGVSPAAQHARKQTCRQGHAFDIVMARGKQKRTCRTCNIEYRRARQRHLSGGE